MPENIGRLKILLAIASPLFAPLYLAKEAGLDSVFKDVDFEYRNAPRKKPSQGDPLVRDVLSLTSHPNCIAAVGDPYRALVKPTGMMDQPVIMGSLIRHMCYWLIDGDTLVYPDNENQLAKLFDQFIVNPRHTSGYAIAADHLLNHCKLAGIEDADKRLYSATIAGYEDRYYRHFRKSRKLAYMTTNPLSLYSQPSDTGITKDYLADPRYRDTLMTGLIVGAKSYAERTAEIDGLMNGIILGIDAINRDPLFAATKLQSYRDEQISFSAEDMPFRSLVSSMEHLAEQGVFPTGGKISQREMDRGAEVRLFARAINPDAPHLLDLDSIKNHVNNASIESDAPADAQNKTERVKHATWIEQRLIEDLSSNKLDADIPKLSAWLIVAAVLISISLSIVFIGFSNFLNDFGLTPADYGANADFDGRTSATCLSALALFLTVPEWVRYVTRVRLSPVRTAALNAISILAVAVLIYLWIDRTTSLGTVLALTPTALFYWFNFHSFDLANTKNLLQRFWRSMVVTYGVLTAPRPTKQPAQ